jgi:hypothetical protein
VSGGPEAGWYPRSTADETQAYYHQVMEERLIASGRVRFLPQHDVLEGGQVVSRLTGKSIAVKVRRRVVDAAYLSPAIPSTSAPPFEVAPGATVVPVNRLTEVSDPPEGFVIVGGGKTALDACVWLLQNGVAPEAIQWIKPRECWLLNRTFYQPGALVGTFLRGIALQMEAASGADSLPDLFDRLEGADQIRRVDRSVRPTMFRGATIADWELELLRRIHRVVRSGHVRRVERDRIVLEGATVPTTPGHLVVHCSARGLPHPPVVSIFQEGRITLQAVRIGLVPFNAAIVAFVETHRDDDAEKNRLCPPNPFPNSDLDWVRGTVIQLSAERAWSQEEDITLWLEGARLNPTRGVRALAEEPAIQEASRLFVESVRPALARLARLMESAPS